jgi:hypothetical protein
MRNWRLTFEFHLPHDRFCLGWQMIAPDEEEDYWTFQFYLLILTITLDLSSGSNEI